MDTHPAAPSKSEEVGAALSAQDPPAEGQQAPSLGAPGPGQHRDEGPGPGAGVGVLVRWSAPPGLRSTKRSVAAGLGRGGHGPSTHGQSVGPGGVVGADGGLSSCNPTLHVSSLGRPPRAKALAASTGERQDGPRPRCPQDTFKDLGAGPHLPAGQGPAKPADTGARLGSPSAVLGWPCDLATSSVSSEPHAWVSAAGPLGHTSWAWPPPPPSPQVPPQPAPSASAPRRGHSRPPRLLERRRQGPLPCRRVPLGGPARLGPNTEFSLERRVHNRRHRLSPRKRTSERARLPGPQGLPDSPKRKGQGENFDSLLRSRRPPAPTTAVRILPQAGGPVNPEGGIPVLTGTQGGRRQYPLPLLADPSPPSPWWPRRFSSTLSRPELALERGHPVRIKKAAAAAPQSAAWGRLSPRSAPLARLYCVPRAPRPSRGQRARAWEAHAGGGPAPRTPIPRIPAPPETREGYGLQTSRRHQLRGRVVCPRQKKTVAASAGYGTGCSSSAPSSAPRSAAGLSGGDALGPDPRSASGPGAPGLAGDAAAAAAAGPGAGAPRGTRTSSTACTPSVIVAAGSTCGVQAVTRSRERHPRPPRAERDPRKQPRPPGCLCLFSLETNAPPAPSRRRGLGGPSPTAGAGAGARGAPLPAASS
ncbi:collagen alpha-1(I) chain-like [Odocoileus virginianus]|uniref:Collagen alpha-1(I) chain-like n=1 Tax=Odocoileus virginianus TaxID=9874 RepID=A0ABM4HNP0_ODOVR